MSLRCLVTFKADSGKKPEVFELKTLPELLKIHPEGLSRSPFWFEEDDQKNVEIDIKNGTLALGGPLLVTHAVRRAADLLLDGSTCDGMTIQLEVAGKRLPELPARAKLESLLHDERTLIVVDGKPYKPAGEVLGFQTVYDDTVRFMDGLKRLGIPQEAMGITATPEEISIEVHPGVFGMDFAPELPGWYRKLLMTIGGIRTGGGQLVRTGDRTLLLNTCSFDVPVLLPGAMHPGLRRPKVGVGPSHFAYGIAAFSDFCGKKRSLDECVREVKTWLKFVDANVAVVPAAKEALEATHAAAEPVAPPATGTSGFAAGFETALGLAGAARQDGAPEPLVIDAGKRPAEFRPFKLEAFERAGAAGTAGTTLATPWAELNRSLGGGWLPNGVHLVAGAREEGKGSFLLQQALHFSSKYGVLYISMDHTAAELMTRVTAWLGRVPAAELVAGASLPGPEGDAARPKLKSLYEAVANAVRDSLYLRGADSAIPPYDADAITELMKMIPAGEGRILFLESLVPDTGGRLEAFLEELRRRSAAQRFTVVASLHLPQVQIPRPHFIDGPDIELLARWQPVSDTLVHLMSERVNLKKFLAMSQGKVDPAVAELLEKRLYQAAAGQRHRNDTYCLARLLHARVGTRSALLFLNQRDLLRFWDGPSMPIGRP